MSDEKRSGKQQRPSAEVLQRMRENLVQMTQYCENTSDCRRFLLLKYFSQDFRKENCHKTCDNCRSDVETEMFDATQMAREMLAMGASWPGPSCVIATFKVFNANDGGRARAPFPQYTTCAGTRSRLCSSATCTVAWHPRPRAGLVMKGIQCLAAVRVCAPHTRARKDAWMMQA